MKVTRKLGGGAYIAREAVGRWAVADEGYAAVWTSASTNAWERLRWPQPVAGRPDPRDPVRGRGNFASAHVTLTDGFYAGADGNLGERVAENWAQVTDRAGEIVPAYGFT